MSLLSLQVRNVGGIERIETEFEDGITLVSGPNASNKTSLLNALAFAIGSEDVSIRSGADRAEVTLSVDGNSVTRTAERNGTSVDVDGEAWLDGEDAQGLSTFAALLEFNDVRASVRNGRPFEEALKAPLDVDALEAERSAKVTRKRELEAELERLAGTESELRSVEDDLATKRERVADLEDDLETLRRERSERTADDELAELREQRADLAAERDAQRRRVGNTEDAIEELEDELAAVEDRIEDAEAELAGHDVDGLEGEKTRLERRVAEREERLEVIQSVLTANRELLDSEFTGVLGGEHSLAGDEYTCWACGRPADEADFEATLDDLVDLVEDDRSRLEENRPELERIEEELSAAREAESRLRELRGERRDVEDALAKRTDSLATQRERLSEIEAELESASESLDAREQEESDAESDRTAEIEETRVALRTARTEADRLDAERERLASRLEERAEVERDVETLQSDIADLTERIENTEREIRESFNGTMDDLVAVLEFDRIKRIWLDGEFDLVIARETEAGVQHESVDHLAESERELVGLVLGLAGYLTYDVDDRVPVLALDSLGAFDATRASRLVEYFADATEFVLAAVHPERASELDFPVSELPATENVDA